MRRNVLITLLAASCLACAPDDGSEMVRDGAPEASQITPGNGTLNRTELTGMERVGATLVIRNVVADVPSFLVVHPFKDGAPVREDYVAATPVPAGGSDNVRLLLDRAVPSGTPMIVMLHEDVNRDGVFQFGDGVTVPDRPVIEGTTIVALPTTTPDAREITPDDVRHSHHLHREKAATYMERAPHRGDGTESRMRALVHKWMELVERPDRNASLYAPILADDFTLNFSSGVIDNAEDFDAWLKGPASALEATAHEVQNLAVAPISDDRHQIDFELDWNGLTSNGGRMQARTRHSWTVDARAAGLPRIETVNVEVIEPFRPTKWN